jgi:hypothetical protein
MLSTPVEQEMAPEYSEAEFGSTVKITLMPSSALGVFLLARDNAEVPG